MLRGETGTGFMTKSQRSNSSNRGLRVAHLQDASKLHEISFAGLGRVFGVFRTSRGSDQLTVGRKEQIHD